jgi:hypothetical protein
MNFKGSTESRPTGSASVVIRLRQSYGAINRPPLQQKSENPAFLIFLFAELLPDS